MSQTEKTWEINGVSLELDLEDADVMERYEKAFETMAKEEQLLPKDGKPSAHIRAYCGIFRNLFSAIFGEERSEQIFAGLPVNAAVFEDIYDQFLLFVKNQQTFITERREERLRKYLPNRAQKRIAKRGK